MERNLLDWAGLAVKNARAAGAKDARVKVRRSRDVSVEWRNGKLDRVGESTKQSLSLSLFVDGRFSANSTSDLREAALAEFVSAAVAATRALAIDEHRHLPDPSRYVTTAPALEINDPSVAALVAEDRLRRVRELEGAVRSEPEAAKIISVTSEVADTTARTAIVTTNGLAVEEEETSATAGMSVTVQGEGERKPEAYFYPTCRFLADLPGVEHIGKEALRRALSQVGAHPAPTGAYDVVLENRIVPTFWRHLLQALSGQAVQQKRSFLDGKLGAEVAAPALSVTDDPHIKRGLGSGLWDGEGMATSPRPLFDAGVLKAFYLDTYYGSKLGMEATTGGMTNSRFALGKRDAAAMVGDLERGIFVTDFLGGNSNATTGDFSVGVRGFCIKTGLVAHPISEMNMAGNHLSFWKALAEVGADEWLYGANRAPSLRFANVEFSGAA